MMLSDGIHHTGDGILEVSEERLKGFIVDQDINEIYDVEQAPFARGKFATVRRATHKKTGVRFAAKFLRRRRRGQCLSKDIGHEIAVLLLCADSKHIVKLHGVHETKTETALLLEMATGGELQAILDDEGALTEQQTISCMKQILKALQYLHNKYIAHLDLKPQNILLAGKEIEDGLKLCDFGISRVVEEGGKVCEILGTPDYVAPEVLNYEPLSLKTDIWSIGVLTYVLLTGCSPFGGDTKQETFLNISQCALTFPDELFEDVSSGAIDFIKSTLRIKPKDRLTVSECLAHPWLSDCVPVLINISNPNDISIEGNNECSSNSKSCNHEDNEEDDDVDDDDDDDDNNSTTSSSSLTIESSNSSSIINHGNDDDVDDIEHDDNDDDHDDETNNYRNEFKLNSIDDNKENILITKYFCKTRELNLIIEEKKDENKLICEKLSTITNHSCSNSQTSQYHHNLHHHNPNQQQQQQQQQVTAVINGLNCSTTTTTTTTTIFPDAPTTPKVCRKAPDSPPSVKELVQRFQIPDKNQSASSSASSSSPITSQQIHSTSTSTSPASSARTRCPYLTCYGPVCRHIESQRQSMGIDQGIIC